MLKLRVLDDDKLIVNQKGQNIDDFDNIINDLKKKYGKGR